MEDDSYYYDDQQRSSPSSGRWLVFAILVILASISMFAILYVSTAEDYLLTIFWTLPIVIFLLYAAFRWAQGRPIDPTDVTEDDRILDQMRRHALPAERVGDLDMYRCTDCGLSFELSNAMPADDEDDKIVHCPFCNTRLIIE
jgi:DNA-directed RNA polymerase subunit RPC12/RpoP